MPESLQIRIVADDQNRFEGRLEGPLELGRQQSGEPGPYVRLPAKDTSPARLIVARQDERDNVSRRHTLLEPLPSGWVRLTNRSKAALPCAAVPGGSLAPGAAAEVTPPFSLSLAGRSIVVEGPDSADAPGLQSL